MFKIVFRYRKVRVRRKRFTKAELKARAIGYVKDKEEARRIISARLVDLNKHYNFTYNRVAIRNQSSRWGSCSKNKNLNFNYKLLHISPEDRDYVIVHELCHLAEMNHGPKFWALVAELCPNYKDSRARLREHIL